VLQRAKIGAQGQGVFANHFGGTEFGEGDEDSPAAPGSDKIASKGPGKITPKGKW